MGRHDTDIGQRARRRPLLIPLAGLALVAAAILTVGYVAPSMIPGMERLPRPWAAQTSQCVSTTVEIIAAPEVAPALTAVLSPLEHRPLANGRCLHTDVRQQISADTASASRILPVAEAPQLWVPDSSTWQARVTGWPLASVGSFATSPVVLAGGQAAIAARGWDQTPPTWTQALTSATAAALPDPTTSAAAIAALAGLYARLGQGAPADRALAASVLAASRLPGQTLDGARTAALQRDPKGPVVVTSEVAVLDVNQMQGSPILTAVYPENATPALDYPLLRVAKDQQDGEHTIAVNAVLAALTSPQAKTAARAVGLRDPRGTPIATQGVASAPVTIVALPATDQFTQFLVRLQSLSIPSRLLTVVDVSLSMRALVPGTSLSRIQLAGAAASAAGKLLSPASSAGLWDFALALPDGKPWQELVPIAPLGATDADGKNHRDAVLGAMATLPTQLSGGGTALYATTLAAIRHVRETYDPRAINSVVLFTDGTNENDPSISLSTLVRQLQADAQAHRQQPVTLIAIGLGATADMNALRAMTAANGGEAYLAQSPQELQTVLFDALSHRSAVSPPTQ